MREAIPLLPLYAFMRRQGKPYVLRGINGRLPRSRAINKQHISLR